MPDRPQTVSGGGRRPQGHPARRGACIYRRDALRPGAASSGVCLLEYVAMQLVHLANAAQLTVSGATHAAECDVMDPKLRRLILYTWHRAEADGCSRNGCLQSAVQAVLRVRPSASRSDAVAWVNLARQGAEDGRQGRQFR